MDKRKRGQSKTMWGTSLKEYMTHINKSWSEVELKATYIAHYKRLSALCVKRCGKDKGVR
jgi:hypothetical protein